MPSFIGSLGLREESEKMHEGSVKMHGDAMREDAHDELIAHRECIDGLDERIVELLNKRQSEALAIRSLKERAGLARYDAAREERLLSRLVEINEGPLNEQDIREIYAAILSASKR